uniref:Uncharacterized protein n=1 Tax=Aegilops tauschii subsp. strangulata TaxID=200361 RepID=A0A453H425_AEGTS
MGAVGVAPLQRFFSSLIRIGIRERSSLLLPGSGRPNPLSRISDREAEADPSPKVRPPLLPSPPRRRDSRSPTRASVPVRRPVNCLF